MKKFTLLSTAFIFFSFICNAQITKRSSFLGGSLGFNQSKQENTSTNQENTVSNFGLGIQLGKATGTNKIFGVYAGTNQSNSKTTGIIPQSRYNFNEYNGGIFYRQYFGLSSKWYLFGNASLGFNTNSSESKNNNLISDRVTGWGAGFFIAPGISFAAGRRLHIESSLSNLFGINYSKAKNRDYDFNGNLIATNENSQLGAQANLSGFNNITFGLRWILPSKGQKS